MLDHPEAAAKLASQIQAAALDVYESLFEQSLNARRSGVTSDDLSKAMMPFLRETRGLLEEIRAPGTVGIVFDLVKTLADYSYGELDDGGCGYDDRPSDPVVDDLLEKLAGQRLEIEPAWDCNSVLEDLKETKEYLSGYGINDFCSQTIWLLSAWKVDGRIPSPVRASKPRTAPPMNGNERRPSDIQAR